MKAEIEKYQNAIEEPSTDKPTGSNSSESETSEPTESQPTTDTQTKPADSQPVTDNSSEPVTDTPSNPVDTKAPDDNPTTPSGDTQTLSYLPYKELLVKGDTIKLIVQDMNGDVTDYDMSPTSMKYDGVSVYSAKIPADLDIYMAQIQYYDGETWVGQVDVSGDQITAAKGKIIAPDGSVYEADNPSQTNPIVTEPTQPNVPKPTTSKVTNKKDNPIKVTVKAKTVKLKKLKKKAQKVKAITVKNNQGKVTYKLVKSGITKRIRKLVKINSKGVITIKKWKKAKKGTYKIKVKITAAGNSNYNAKTVTKVVKVKIK